MAAMTNVMVRLQFPGFHCWPSAPASLAFLRHLHRHLFFVMVSLEVGHSEREVEILQLKDWLECECIPSLGPSHNSLLGLNLGAQSCETLAHRIAGTVLHRYGDDRVVTVSVLEDNENGAQVVCPLEAEEGAEAEGPLE